MPDPRYDAFLSYAHVDEAAARQVNDWLHEQGLETFFDQSQLRPGLRWIPAVEDAIGDAAAVVILIGAHGVGNTQKYERELAIMRQTREPRFPVIPVLLPGCEKPPTGFLTSKHGSNSVAGTACLTSRRAYSHCSLRSRPGRDFRQHAYRGATASTTRPP